MTYTGSLLDNQEEIVALTAEWNDLIVKSRTSTVFQSPTFLTVWWESLGVGKRLIVTVRDGQGKLVAIAPLFLESTNDGNTLNLLGCVNVSDYLDVLIDRDEAEVDDLYQTLLTEVASIDWKKLFWCSLPESTLTRQYLKSYFKNRCLIGEVIQDVAPVIQLPPSWDEYLESVGRKQRHEIRRKQRKLAEAEHAFEVLDRPTEKDVEEFIVLHKQSSQQKEAFWDDRHLIFFRKLIPALSADGKIKLFFLSVEGQRVASMLAFSENKRLELYNSGFAAGVHDELSIGSNLIAYTIKFAIEQGLEAYDFLRGNEQYKFRFGAIATNVYDITVLR